MWLSVQLIPFYHYYCCYNNFVWFCLLQMGSSSFLCMCNIRVSRSRICGESLRCFPVSHLLWIFETNGKRDVCSYTHMGIEKRLLLESLECHCVYVYQLHYNVFLVVSNCIINETFDEENSP